MIHTPQGSSLCMHSHLLHVRAHSLDRSDISSQSCRPPYLRERKSRPRSPLQRGKTASTDNRPERGLFARSQGDYEPPANRLLVSKRKEGRWSCTGDLRLHRGSPTAQGISDSLSLLLAPCVPLTARRSRQRSLARPRPTMRLAGPWPHP